MTEDKIKRFALVDPRSFDGDPFEVAQRAVLQGEGLARLLVSTLGDARIMARNAEMERELQADGECDATAFEDTALARQIDKQITQAEEAVKALRLIARAAGYNPRKPIGRD